MPFHYVQRYSSAAVVSGGTQYIATGGTLAFTAPTTIELDPSVFTVAGTYTLFDYSAGSFPVPAQLSNVTINDNDLIGLSYQAGSLTDTGATITITLA